MELRSVPLRIRNVENLLGSPRDGPIYASHHGLCQSTAASLTVWRCAGCSVERFADRVCLNTSARIMIPCIDSINGKRIFAYSE